MRTFATRGMLCDYGHLISRVEEVERGLETRYACPKSRRIVNIQKHGKQLRGGKVP